MNNFSWDLSYKIGGSYSFLLSSSKEHYNSNSTLFSNWLTLVNYPPIVENISVTPETGGWGEVFTFKADVLDLQRDTVVCKLYIFTGKGEWLFKGSKIIPNGVGTCEINVTDFDCGDINITSLTKFKFEIDDGTNIFNTTEVLAPSIERNDVTLILITGNNSFVNRTYGSTLFSMRIRDLDRNVYPANVNVSVFATKDENSYSFLGIISSNSTGYLNYNFAPDCSFSTGIQKWKFEVNDSCYKRVSSEDYITTIYGWLQNTITEPLNGKRYLRGSNVTILGYVNDECNNFVSVDVINIKAKSNQTLQ